MDIDSISTNTRLTAVTELGCDAVSDRFVQVSVVKDDEGCVTAKLHRNLLHTMSTLHGQGFAHTCRTCEGELADLVVLSQYLANLAAGVPHNDIDYAGRDAIAFG